MEVSVWVAVTIEAVTMIIIAVWAVSSIKGTTDLLGSRIGSLTGAVDRLENKIDETAQTQVEHTERIARLEVQAK